MTSTLKIGSSSICAVGLVALLWAIYVYYKRRRGRIDASQQESNASEVDEEMKDNEKSGTEVKNNEAVTAAEERRKLVFIDGDGGFDLDKLLAASAESLGKGSFGGTFKATFDDGRAFVVKRVRDLSPLTNEEFGEKMRVLGELKHPNVFPILGYYYEKEEKLLVYNLAEKGNLFARIHGGRGKSTRIPFKWNSRLSVAKSVARAMEFLHQHANALPIAPHGNLKSSNVLLESDSHALVADYSLMSLLSSTIAPLRLVMYWSPEYQNSRKLYKKSDVWSYGCLLLELLTGKIPAYSTNRGGTGREIVNWVHRAVREEWTCEVFDREIGSERGALQGMFKLLQVGLWCCEVSLTKRPDMTEVVKEVEGILSPNQMAVVSGDKESEGSFTSDSVSVSSNAIN